MRGEVPSAPRRVRRPERCRSPNFYLPQRPRGWIRGRINRRRTGRGDLLIDGSGIPLQPGLLIVSRVFCLIGIQMRYDSRLRSILQS